MQLWTGGPGQNQCRTRAATGMTANGGFPGSGNEPVARSWTGERPGLDFAGMERDRWPGRWKSPFDRSELCAQVPPRTDAFREEGRAEGGIRLVAAGAASAIVPSPGARSERHSGCSAGKGIPCRTAGALFRDDPFRLSLVALNPRPQDVSSLAPPTSGPYSRSWHLPCHSYYVTYVPHLLPPS